MNNAGKIHRLHCVHVHQGSLSRTGSRCYTVADRGNMRAYHHHNQRTDTMDRRDVEKKGARSCEPMVVGTASRSYS